jgi:hypothetical protein
MAAFQEGLGSMSGDDDDDDDNDDRYVYKQTGLLYEQGSRLTDGRRRLDDRVIKHVGLYSAACSKTENDAIH